MPQEDKRAPEAPNIQTSKNSSAVRLAKGIEMSNKRLERYNQHSVILMKQFAGPYYTAFQNSIALGEYAKREPFNSVATIVSIMLPNLVGTRIKSSIKVKKLELQAFADLFKLLNDHVLDQIDYAGTLLRIVTASLFGMGISKTILDVKPLNDDPDFPNYLQDAGFPYVGQVDQDNYILDPACTMREACSFEGDRFLIPVVTAKESGLYDTADLEALNVAYHNQVSEDKPAGLSKGNGNGDQFEDFYQFASVYLPREKMIVTLDPEQGDNVKYLKEQAYEGPEGGPYNVLGYQYPPNNSIPVPPVSIFLDMHLAVNEMVRKVARQSKRAKSLGLFQASKTEDAESIKNASDGELVPVSDPNSVKEFSFGGAEPELYKAVDFFREILNWVSGNPDTVGGLAAGEKTLGQDEMKLTQASARLGHMQSQVQKFSKQVLRKVSWYNWTDPQTDMALLQKLPGGIEVSRLWSPDVREGEFPDYDVDVDPYVVSSENPLEQYRRMTQLFTQIIVPMADKLAAQGKGVDIGEVISDMGDAIDVDTSRWVTDVEPVQGLQPSTSPGSGGGGQGPATRGPQPQGGPARAPEPAPRPETQEAPVA